MIVGFFDKTGFSFLGFVNRITPRNQGVLPPPGAERATQIEVFYFHPLSKVIYFPPRAGLDGPLIANDALVLSSPSCGLPPVRICPRI